jgi:hypothetical protein
VKLSLKAIAIALAMGVGVMTAVPGVRLVQPALADSAAEREAVARELIAEALPASRMPEIYDELRVTLHNVYLPVMHEIASGKIPSGLPADPKFTQIIVKLVGFMDFVVKASDEVDPFIKSSREEMIADVAQLMAKHMSSEELENVRAMLKLKATQKSFDALYTTSKAITGYTIDEVREWQIFSGWLNGFIMQMAGGQPPVANATPTPTQLQKAQAIVTDLMSISHVDEMVADGVRFAREVVVKSVPAEAQPTLSAQIDQFEFTYNMQKSVVVAAIPTALAQVMKDDDLEKVHTFMKTSGFTKTFTLLQNIEKSVTAYTLDDITAAKTFFEEMEKKGKMRERTAEQKAAAEADWNALGEKWGGKFMNAVSPATREGLMKSLAELQAIDELK